MNETIGHQAEAYRLQADELRAAAEDTRDLHSREALRRLADGYDRLAQNLDRVAARSQDLDATGTDPVGLRSAWPFELDRTKPKFRLRRACPGDP